MTLRTTALHAAHLDLGAKMVPFGGWDMPVSYPAGTLDEHMSCRTSAVMFDVSHLGTVRVEGPGSFDRLQQVLTNDLGKVSVGRAQYTHLLDPADASVIDDIIVWWVGDDVFDVMPNASNTDRVVRYLGGVDTTATRSVIAVQGPRARDLVRKVSSELQRWGAFASPKLWCAGCRVSWRVPVTRGRTASKSRFRPSIRGQFGTRCRIVESSRRAWARATRCVSRQVFRCTDTNSVRESRRCKRI